jgi:hypothetical protein
VEEEILADPTEYISNAPYQEEPMLMLMNVHSLIDINDSAELYR